MINYYKHYLIPSTFFTYQPLLPLPLYVQTKCVTISDNNQDMDLKNLKESLHKITDSDKNKYVYSYDDIENIRPRDIFRDRLKQSLAFARRYKFKLAILSIDLDTLSNEEYAEISEEIINEAGKKICIALRETDTVSVQGIDELVVILPDIEAEENAYIVANKIITVLADPFDVNGKEVYIEPYIGISIYPFDSENTEELLKYATVSMVEAKNREKIILRLKSKDIENEKN